MVPLYALLVAVLSGLRAALTRRASRTERKYARAALDAQNLAEASRVKPGSGGAGDPFAAAKRQYGLGRLVEARDRLEARFLSWQARAEAVGDVVARLRGWNGRAVPYLLGVADAGLVLAALTYLGPARGLTADAVKGWVETLKM